MLFRPFFSSACAQIVILLCLAAPLLAAPTVSNVSIFQQPNGAGGTEAVITYDLVSPDGPCEITVSLSKDGGTDGFIHPVTSISGDVTGVAAGTGLTIVWDIATDYPDEEIPNAIVRVFADDGCPVGQPDSFTTDEDTPVSGNVFADNGSGPDTDTLTGTLTVVAVNGDPAAVGGPTLLPSGAVVTIGSNGSFSYDPNSAFESLGSGDVAMDSLTYTLTDGVSPCSELVTVSLTITGVNDPPVVTGESFDTAGNTTLQVAAVQSIAGAVFVTGSLLDNDFDIDGPAALTASFVSVTPGASATVNPNGTFTLTPPPGSNAAVTLNYSVSDGSASTPGVATITPMGMIWYVKNDAPGGGTGTSAAPFNALADAGTASSPGHTIYIHTGDGMTTGQNSGVTLQGNQRLIGEGTAMVFGGTLNGASFPILRPAGTRPIVGNSAGSAVNLVLNNQVFGLNIGDTVGGFALSGANVGVLSVTNVTVSGVGGIINVSSSGAFGSNVNFDSVSSSGTGGVSHINLVNVTGTLGLGVAGTGLTGSGSADSIAVSGGNVSFTYPGTISKSTAGRILAVSDTTGGTITLSNATAGGISSSGSSQGIRINNCAGSVVIGGAAGPAGTVSLTGTIGIEIRGAAATPQSGSVTLNNAVIQTSAGAGNIAVRVDGDQGSATDNAVTGVIAFNNVDITNPGGSVASIIGLGGGSVTFDATSSIARGDGGLGIQVDSCSGGVVTFAGASKVLNTGTNGAIALTSNSGCTINFTNGGLDIDTTSGTGFSATGGGTVSVQGSANTINSTTGTGLNISSTSIAAAGATFQHISSNGGTATGIILDSTGSMGGLTVTGTGTPDSGGTIANKSGSDGSTGTGVGIFLNNTTAPSFSRMQLNDFQNFAIRGVEVTNLTMAGVSITGTNGTNASIDEASVAFGYTTVVGPTAGLLGSASITDCTFGGGAVESTFLLRNGTGTLNRVTFTNCSFASLSTIGDALSIESTGTAVIRATVDDCDFTSAAGDLFQFNNIGTSSTNDLVFSGNTLTNNNPLIATGGGGVTIGGGDLGGSLAYSITNNTFRDSVGPAILLAKSTGAGTFSGTFSGNTIGAAGTANSGSREGSALKLQNAGAGTVSCAITNNQIFQYNNFGIEILTGGGSMAQDGNMLVTATGNTISNPGNFAGAAVFAKNGIHLNAGTVPGDTYLVCLDLGGAGGLANSLSNSGAPNDSMVGGEDIRLRQRMSTTVQLRDYSGANNNNAAVQSYLAARNAGDGVPATIASNTVGSGGVGYTNSPGGGTCTP